MNQFLAFHYRMDKMFAPCYALLVMIFHSLVSMSDPGVFLAFLRSIVQYIVVVHMQQRRHTSCHARTTSSRIDSTGRFVCY